jgi:uncharacterized protein (TIGR04255 family)
MRKTILASPTSHTKVFRSLVSTKKEIYAKAPIVEAVLDIRVRTSTIPTLEDLSLITDEAYPEPFRRPFQLQVKIQGGTSPDQPSIEQLTVPLGVMFRSKDAKQVFQARVDGFTFNRLTPYEHWESFSLEAHRLWDLYAGSVNVEHIESIGLTYLNEILVPVGTPFEQYFRTYIEVAPEIPQVLNNYSLSFQVTLPEGHGLLSITQGYGPPRKEGFVTNFLNIQATKTFGDDKTPSNEEVWQMFENLRAAKSGAFESCITDAVREMIR